MRPPENTHRELRPPEPGVREAAGRVLAYLAEVDAPAWTRDLAGAAADRRSLQTKSDDGCGAGGAGDGRRPMEHERSTSIDAIIGFGVFDLALPRFCAELFAAGVGRALIFTGGYGAGTGDLGGPEASVWRKEVLRAQPEIPDSAFVLETRSSNTAENIRFTAELLARERPDLAFGSGIKSAVIVASPSRLRRVRLTMRHLVPEVAVTRLLPPVDFERERALYERQGVDYVGHLAGELERLATYPGRGWIAAEPLPTEIVAAGAVLRGKVS
ncbi:MAG TPA: YdcF family protein [Opitutaceae bacterium]|nr:YdcF family protein [Opitutaceae bacterium]